MLHKLSFYKTAADLLKLVKDSGKNVKNILYSERKYKYMNIKALYAIVTEALKHWPVLELLITQSEILIKEPNINVWHVRILATELLFGKKELDGEHEFVQTLLKYEKKFRKILSKDDVQNVMLNLPNLNVVGVKVRYIKVNTIISDVESVINTFNSEGWEQLPRSDSYQDYLNQLTNLEPDSQLFLQDFHISEVIAFPPGTELHEHQLYKNGSFYFMDKSSCLAPYLLQPHPHAAVLDMCAAPGLKAIHLASLVPSGKVYAVERDASRYKTLQEMVGYSGAENVVTIPGDVTGLELDKYKDVEYILLDPSCSGSGMRDRQPRDNHEGSDNIDRLYRLQSFQLTLLRFALTRFPAAKRVVYSTCSVNVEENEEVVLLALNSKYHNFDVVSIEKKLPGWTSFGSNQFKFGPKCVYSLPESDFTNGFFVAVFERKNSYSNDETELLPKGGYDDDQEYVFECKNNYSKCETESFTNSGYDEKPRYSKGKYEIGQEPQKDTTTNMKEESKVPKESPVRTSLKNIQHSKKRSNSETNSNNDDNDYSQKKVKKDESSQPNILKESMNKQSNCNNVAHPAGLNISKTLKKPTVSYKKRLRRMKLKSKFPHNSNKDKTKIKTLKKSNQSVQNKKINAKSKTLLENMKINNENKNKPSKSKIRQLRLKKLKMITRSDQCENDNTLEKDLKKQKKNSKCASLDSGKSIKTKHKVKIVTNSEETVITDNIHTAIVPSIENSHDTEFNSVKEPNPCKQKHKKNKHDKDLKKILSYDTIENNEIISTEGKKIDKNKLHKKKMKQKLND